MDEITAEMIGRGRDGDPVSSAQRRRLAIRVREVREKLTSSGSGHRAFDVELTRVFAERHRGAGPALSLLALGVAAIATLWVPIVDAVVWLSVLCVAIVGLSTWVNRCLADQDPASHLMGWQRRFAFGEAMRGIAWALLASVFLHVDDPAAQTFVLCILLLVAATTAMLSATVPMAVYANLLPITIAIVVFTRPHAIAAMPLLTITLGAQAFFLVLARRLYFTTLETLSVQAEKDGLIVELEQAKLNSDEARRRAEEASLAKSRFLATMSHELRTPLNAILGFSEVMKGELFGTHANPTYRDYSNDIHSSGQHLLMLINEILDLSRVEAGRYELREESVALADIADDCKHLLAIRASKRNIRLTDFVEPNLPRIWADERAIRQIVLNLLSNAIKFTPQGGTVTIKVGWTSQGGQYVSIRDTGPGIPESEIPTVMSSFGRGTLAQKNADEGSGLGLPIVKGLIELHGGVFTLTSKVREGTEVVMILPPQRVIDALPPMREDEAAAGKPRKRGSPMQTAA